MSNYSLWKLSVNGWDIIFPSIPARSQFVRQSANLWQIKIMMQQRVMKELGANTDDLHFVDGFPAKVCVISRAKRCRRFKDDADYGYCASKDEHFYGFQCHLLIDSKGMPVDLSLTNAKTDEREVVPELIEQIEGCTLGDKGYISVVPN